MKKRILSLLMTVMTTSSMASTILPEHKPEHQVAKDVVSAIQHVNNNSVSQFGNLYTIAYSVRVFHVDQDYNLKDATAYIASANKTSISNAYRTDKDVTVASIVNESLTIDQINASLPRSLKLKDQLTYDFFGKANADDKYPAIWSRSKKKQTIQKNDKDKSIDVVYKESNLFISIENQSVYANGKYIPISLLLSKETPPVTDVKVDAKSVKVKQDTTPKITEQGIYFNQNIFSHSTILIKNGHDVYVINVNVSPV